MLIVRTAIMAVCSGVLLTACAVPNATTDPMGAIKPWITPVPPQNNANTGVSSFADVYKYQGSRQCENGGVPLAEMQRQLQMSNIPVTNASCGTDGRMYPQFCGGADGKINIFTIPSAALDAALAQGFVLLNQLPEAQRANCYGNAPANNNGNGTSTTYPYNNNNNNANNHTNTTEGFVPYTGGNNESYYSYQ